MGILANKKPPFKWGYKAKMDLRPRFTLSLLKTLAGLRVLPMLSKVLYPYITAQHLKSCLNTRLRAKGWVSTVKILLMGNYLF